MKKFFLLSMVVCLSNCSSPPEKHLIGFWQAVGSSEQYCFMENGQYTAYSDHPEIFFIADYEIVDTQDLVVIKLQDRAEMRYFEIKFWGNDTLEFLAAKNNKNPDSLSFYDSGKKYIRSAIIDWEDYNSKNKRNIYKVEYTTLFSGVKEGKILIYIEGEHEINGKKYFKEVVTTSGIPGAEDQINYYRTELSGYYQYEEKYQQEYYSPRFVAIGARWVIVKPDERIYCKVESMEKYIELFNGENFKNCLIVSSLTQKKSGWGWNNGSKTKRWFAQGVGVIKESGNTDGVNYTVIIEE